MTHTPTPEQAAIILAAQETTDNLMVSALAGAAKTSTLQMIAKALPNKRILAIAFNKSIATEMADRLPGNAEARTLNSIGHRAWAEKLGGKRLTLKSNKMGDILKAAVDVLPPREKSEAYDNFANLNKYVRHAKAYGYIPDGTQAGQKFALRGDDEFFGDAALFWEEPTGDEIDLIKTTVSYSIEQALAGTIDFDDQIYMPTLWRAGFYTAPLILVDEVQDLSALNHAMLKQMVTRRLIAVGDRCQAIYGFRGAHASSMDVLKDEFSMVELGLSVSFRCPVKVVEAARWRAPHMKYPDWAKEGTVTALQSWSVSDMQDGDAIICRNNAPLFRMALRLLANGQYPQIIGNDIGKSLIKTLRKFGQDDLGKADVEAKLEAYHKRKLARVKNEDRLSDEIECLRVFIEAGENLGAMIAYAEHIMNAAGRIKLMTGHKSKGLEFDRVWFLDQDLIKLDHQQEQNLKYVIQTRSKDTLFYINTEDFVADVPGEEGAPS